MAIPALVDGAIPSGRHVCTEADLRDRFVSHADFANSRTRTGIWNDWEQARTLLTQSVVVYSVWLSGSFLTDKLDPGDIDVAFVISGEDRAKRSPADRQIIESFITRVRNPLGGVMPLHGLRVDSFVVNWAPHQMLPNGQLTPGHQVYAMERGYWDDFWSRKRVSAKTGPAVRPDALPKRGYVEVSLNAYR